MNVIVVRRGQGPHRLSLGRRHLGLAAGGVVLCATAIAIAGYFLGRNSVRVAPAFEVHALKAQLARKSAALDKAKLQARAAINAIAAQMAQLDAEVTRLDAMGAEIVKLAGLRKSGFDFKAPVGEGGPVPPKEVPWQRADLDEAATALSGRVWNEKRQLSALETFLLDSKLSAQVVPRGSPIRKGWISSGWGWRTDPLTGEREFHEGIDFAGPEGEPVHAIAAGIVTWAGPRYGYGNLVIVNDGAGYMTYYAHNEKVLVKVGEVVERGERIALLGDTGMSTGPHVHLEVHYKGRPVDPAKYVLAKGGIP